MKWFKRLFDIGTPYFMCRHCGSGIWESGGTYARGWNNMCGQASGDYGYWCNKCLHISFKKTNKEHNSTKSDWCTESNYPNH